MTKAEVQQVLRRLEAATRSKEPLVPLTVAIWNEELLPLSFERALKAANTIIRKQPWFPTVAEFMDAYRQGEVMNMPATSGADWFRTEDGQRAIKRQFELEAMSDIDYWNILLGTEEEEAV